MYQHWQMTLPLLLSVYYRYYCRSGPSTANIRTSGYPFYRYCTGTVYFALVVEFVGWNPPVGFVGWDPSCDQQS